MLGKKLKTNENNCEKTPSIQKVLTDTSDIPIQKFKDKDGEIFKNNLESFDFEKNKAIRGEPKSGRYKNSKTIFQKRVDKSNWEGRGSEKKIIPSNIIDIYTRIPDLKSS